MSSIKREFEKPKTITIKLTYKEATIFQERVVRICNDVILNHEILSEQERENFEILKNMCDQVTDQLTVDIKPVMVAVSNSPFKIEEIKDPKTIQVITASPLKKDSPVKLHPRIPHFITAVEPSDLPIKGIDSIEVMKEKASKILGYALHDYQMADIAEIVLRNDQIDSDLGYNWT